MHCDVTGGQYFPADDAEGIADAISEAIGGLRYDDVRQKSSHNSYERREAILDQIVYHRIRSIELDTHNSKFRHETRDGDWLVYHGPQRRTTCNRLSDCLDELDAFHGANPEHEVLTVFIDLKDDWEAGRNPDDLDDLLASTPAFTPEDLLAACPTASSLQEAVTNDGCDWPTLSSLRGRFIFVLTGNDGRLFTYAGSDAEAAGRSAFIARGLGSTDLIDDDSQVVFFNMRNGGDNERAGVVADAGFVSRIYNLNDEGAWAGAVANRAHHLATDMVNFHEDVWARTHNALGWPFEVIDGDTPEMAEIARTLSVEVSSDDIWNKKDDFVFLYQELDQTAGEWSTSVSTPNSHVNQWAKGCLMARADLSEGAANFAVCRPADRHKLRIQWRPEAGEKTHAAEVDIVPEDTVDQESLTFIRLVVGAYDEAADETCANGYGSLDGSEWTLIGNKCIAGELAYQGVATSSHGEDAVKFVYTNLSRFSDPRFVDDFGTAEIGTVRSSSEFDGIFPGGGGGPIS